MKKYILAALTFVVSLVGLMIINAIVMKGAAFGIGKYVVCGITLGATGAVYRKFRDEENLKNYGTTEMSKVLLKSDRKGFKEAFSKMNAPEFRLEEVFVANGKDGVSDFIVGIRTKENAKPDFEKIKAVLYKTFYPQIKFVFINMNEMGEESKSIFAGGVKIK